MEGQKSADLQATLDRLVQYGGASAQGGSLRSLVGQAVPGTTSGEQAFEAQGLLKDPGYLQRQQTATAGATAAQKEQADLMKAAEAYAKQRTQEESGIASQSRDYLVGQRGAIESDLQKALTQAQAKDAATQKSFEDIMAGGALPQDLAHNFDTTTEAGKAAAQAKWDEILGKYPTVKDLPLLQLGSHKGQLDYSLPQEYYTQHPDILTRPDRDALQQAVYARQKELEQFFSPQDTWFGPGQGEFSQYKPLYFAGDQNAMDTEVPSWQGEDPRNYLSLQQGNATRETVATPEQRDKFNTINELMNEAERLAQTDPFRGAMIVSDVEQFLADENQSLGRWDVGPTQAGEEWQRTLYEIQRRVQHAKTQNDLMGTILQVGGGGLAASPLAPLGWGLIAEGTRRKAQGIQGGNGATPPVSEVR